VIQKLSRGEMLNHTAVSTELNQTCRTLGHSECSSCDVNELNANNFVDEMRLDIQEDIGGGR
jgi:hypothetical protein